MAWSSSDRSRMFVTGAQRPIEINKRRVAPSHEQAVANYRGRWRSTRSASTTSEKAGEGELLIYR